MSTDVLEQIDIGKLKKALVDGAYITPEDISAAEKKAKTEGTTFIVAVIALGTLTEDLLGQAVAESIGMKYADRDSMPTQRELILRIPESIARNIHTVFISETGSSVSVASSTADSKAIQAALKSIFPKKKINVYYTLPNLVETAMRLYEKPLADQFKELFSSHKAFVPEVIERIFAHAVDLHVSDIHFEPRQSDVVVRFRIDGVLLEVARMPKPFFGNILNRIKVLARLPLDEHFRTQDGSLRYLHTEGAVNVRVSIAPTIDGEKIALRILPEYSSHFSTDSLGLSPEDQATLAESAKKPFGMVLVTGPTGSGKTTTLYAFLRTLNTIDVNITTIEDPVEYRVEGVNQMQTNASTELTFARGLRSIVRQDPDIVLVGEIRDRETAEVAVNASLTGHLLFSTFHSNDAATTIPRLLDIGIEPFLLGSTLELIVAQRLVRTLCTNCRSSYTYSRNDLQTNMPKIARFFGEDPQVTFYKGVGCNACHQTGYRGRIGIFELVRNTPAMQELIANRPSRADIWNLAKREGSRSLFEDGLSKVREGVTTVDELLRVAPPPQT